jgi:trk system potassium uptake protein TrkA
VYQRLGIPTVATVRWTADQMLRRLLPEGAGELWRDPTGEVVLAEVAYDPAWVGEKVHALEDSTGARVAFLTRLGEAMLPAPGMVLQEGDVLHLMAAQRDLGQLQAALGTRDGSSRRVQEKRAQGAQRKGGQ